MGKSKIRRASVTSHSIETKEWTPTKQQTKALKSAAKFTLFGGSRGRREIGSLYPLVIKKAY